MPIRSTGGAASHDPPRVGAGEGADVAFLLPWGAGTPRTDAPPSQSSPGQAAALGLPPVPACLRRL